MEIYNELLKMFSTLLLTRDTILARSFHGFRSGFRFDFFKNICLSTTLLIIGPASINLTE